MRCFMALTNWRVPKKQAVMYARLGEIAAPSRLSSYDVIVVQVQRLHFCGDLEEFSGTFEDTGHTCFSSKT